jgi:glycosyltransferase involved in cell wall biosynthesis
MNRPFLLFRGPVESVSGYGSHSRDLLRALYDMDLFHIRVDSSNWGITPLTALEDNNLFHKWIKDNIVTNIQSIPDVYVQVTVPNEFRPIGKFNIGITAGIETTIIPFDWIDGCNKMDLIITTSQFSKTVLSETVYDEKNKETNQVIKQHRIIKPIEVLFEGADTNIYNDVYKNFDLDISEDFCFVFVGHWLKGNLGEDRKNIGWLIKTFVDTFKNEPNKPALILKTSSGTFSVIDRESIREKIMKLIAGIENPPSIYLLFGDLTDEEMNNLYNHPKVKAMVSFTRGEGFGRPLLEFTMTGKPVIASNWSGHKDFLNEHYSVLLSGTLTPVHDSAVDQFILKDSRWFSVDYKNASFVLKQVKDNYDFFLKKSNTLMNINKVKFSYTKMVEAFKDIITPHLPNISENSLLLPELTKVA